MVESILHKLYPISQYTPNTKEKKMYESIPSLKFSYQNYRLKALLNKNENEKVRRKLYMRKI